MKRCSWPTSDLAIAYHDTEWGVPVHDDRRHFEFLTLEGAQAGLSWETILKKREGYREAFAGFDPGFVAGFDDEDVERLVADPGIVRHRGKIASAIGNARAMLEIKAKHGSFDTYVWEFVDGSPVVNAWETLEDVPSVTERSAALSRDLRRRGFNFVGPTICYAYMQAAGLVNDHTVDCFRHAECQQLHGASSIE